MRWQRIIIIVSWPLAAVAAPGLDALCEGERTADVVVDASEFAIIGFDVETQALSIRPPRTLLSDKHGPCRLRLDDEHLLLPVTPDAVQLILDAWTASALELMIRVKRLDRDQPPARSGCQQLVPERVELRIGELTVAERVLKDPLPARPSGPIHVGPLLAESWVKPFPTERLRASVDRLAAVCLRRQGDAALNIRGSLSVQLRKDAEGAAAPPEVAVDGLVNAPITACLLHEIGGDARVWRELPNAALVYVPVFFRSSLPPPPPPAQPERGPQYIRAMWSPQ